MIYLYFIILQVPDIVNRTVFPPVVKHEVPPHVVLHIADITDMLHLVMVGLHMKGQTVPMGVGVLTLSAGVADILVGCSVVFVEATLIRELFITFITEISDPFMNTFMVAL